MVNMFGMVARLMEMDFLFIEVYQIQIVLYSGKLGVVQTQQELGISTMLIMMILHTI